VQANTRSDHKGDPEGRWAVQRGSAGGQQRV
jgi:hypothetical protein